jgi:hypothetical protein
MGHCWVQVLQHLDRVPGLEPVELRCSCSARLQLCLWSCSSRWRRCVCACWFVTVGGFVLEGVQALLPEVDQPSALALLRTLDDAHLSCVAECMYAPPPSPKLRRQGLHGAQL